MDGFNSPLNSSSAVVGFRESLFLWLLCEHIGTTNFFHVFYACASLSAVIYLLPDSIAISGYHFASKMENESCSGLFYYP